MATFVFIATHSGNKYINKYINIAQLTTPKSPPTPGQSSIKQIGFQISQEQFTNNSGYL